MTVAAGYQRAKQILTSIPENMRADIKRLLFDVLSLTCQHSCPNAVFTKILKLMGNKQIPKEFRCVRVCPQ